MLPREIYFVFLKPGAVTQAGLIFLLLEGSDLARGCGIGIQAPTSHVSAGSQKVCLTKSSPVSSLTAAAERLSWLCLQPNWGHLSAPAVPVNIPSKSCVTVAPDCPSGRSLFSLAV